jgi:mono/diheme cytochrome c family protein
LWGSLIVLVVGLVAAVATASAQKPAADDDAEERAEREFLARRAVQENCLICHAEEMIAGQRLTAKQWGAEVEKMVGWGSPLPAEAREGVVAYLAARYPDTAPPDAPRLLSFAQAHDTVRPDDRGDGALKGSADRGGPLYARHCANCHGADGQGADLGPNLVEKPVLRRPAEFDEFVKQGRGRMPGFAPLVGPDDESHILVWLRSRRYQPPGEK